MSRLVELVLVPSGTWIGATGTIEVSSFLAAREPTSNAAFREFLAASGVAPPPYLEDERLSAPDQPVVGVSWHHAALFCDWLTGRLGVRCRLPTETEREHAAAGGLAGAAWPWGDEAPETSAARRAIAGLGRPHAPSEACANGFGLRCMGDNVHEWCSDWAVPHVRRSSRGGSWRHAVPFSRVRDRSSLDPARRYSDYGFRVVATP